MEKSSYRSRVIEAARLLQSVLHVYGHTHLSDCVQNNIDDWSCDGSFIARSNLTYAAAVAVRDLMSELLDMYNRSPEFIQDGYVDGRSIRKMLNKIVLYFL